MYGTVAFARLKPEFAGQFGQLGDEVGVAVSPGQVGVYVYQMDADPQNIVMAIMFESREAYHANAQSPEQYERFMKLMHYLESEPQWHDGEIVWFSGVGK